VGLGRRWDAVAEFHGRFDVVAVTTETRHAAPAEVVAAVTAAVGSGWPVELVCCRIDTTLRGNVGIAAEAVLRAVSERSGRRCVGLCAPAHPPAGRCTVDGFQLLNGTRLEATELARDPRSPVRTSSVAEVLGTRTSLTTAHVPLSAVTGGGEGLRRALRAAVDSGVGVVVVDAMTEQHLADMAAAAAAVADGQDYDWVGIDPGPASAALAAALGVRGRGQEGPLLAVSGSATDLTRTQLQAMVEAHPTRVVRPTRSAGGRVPDVDATAAELAKVADAANAGEVVLLATALTADDVVPLQQGDGPALAQALGQVTRRVMEDCVVGGLYTTGGDVTAAVLEALGARGLEVEEEVLPLAVAGALVDGPWAGVPIVTKGGLVGDDRAAVVCITQLARTAAAHTRRVQAVAPPSPG
jgi:D-threonate/D-erythronate kinase